MYVSWLRAVFVFLIGVIAMPVWAAAPTATTQPATDITRMSAVLNGVGTPAGEATTGRFRYSATNPMVCNDMFGTRVPMAGGTDLGTGASPVPYSITTTGLTPGVTYYYCAIVTNATGTAFGNILSFTIPTAPAVTTNMATMITASSATLQGSANPLAANTTGWFRYSSTNPGMCSDMFGTRIPSSSGTGLGAGIAAIPYSQPIAGLTPGTTYYVCAIANNIWGTSFGAIQTFTTPAMAPTVYTSAASNLTRTTATLNGSTNPGGDATKGWFRYNTASPGTCNDTFGTRIPAMGGASLGSGVTYVNHNESVTGLMPATTYYYCAIASNAQGTSWGSVQTFISPAAPTAVTSSATSLSNTTAQINGSGNPNRAEATGWFRYALTNPGACDDKFGSRAPVMGGVALGSEVGDVPMNQSLSGLSPATVYYFCAIVKSAEGTAFGSVLTFTTSSPPAVATGAATMITANSATLNGTGTPNLAATGGWFRYSTTEPATCTEGFGARSPSSGSVSLGAGSMGVPYGSSITGLASGTKYYYCAIVSNAYGLAYGAVMSFTTGSMAPLVQTSGATNLTRTTATLQGYGNPGGDATTGWFRYSLVSPGTCNDSFGTRAPMMGGSALGAGNSYVTFSQAIMGLAPATTYYYCALAANSMGTVTGSITSFVTPSAPVAATSPASAVTTNTAQLNGTGNPNRSTTVGWFRYSDTAPMACDDKFGSRAPLTGTMALGDSTSPEPFAQGIAGLSSGTTYYYCAIVASTEGTSFGAVVPFTTSGAPTAVTVAASTISANGATLNGTGNPNGATAYGWLRYSATNPMTCTDSFGTRAPTSGSGAGLGAGVASVPYAYGISGLTPGTTYYYCAIVNNSYGVGYGAVMSFTTPTTAPTVSTGYPTALTRTTATLQGYGNPGGDATTGWFRYSSVSPGTCNDTFGTRAPMMGGVAMGAVTTNVSFSQAVTGLSPNTTYYTCALASNSMGLVMGSVVSFVTPSAPVAVTQAANGITTSTAELNGAGTPNRSAANGWFRYSPTAPMACDDKFGSRAPVMGTIALGSDTTPQGFSASIGGLSGGTTYYFCAIVASTEGTAFGEVLSFTTSGISTATTVAANNITANSAVLNGSGNPNGATAYGWFRYSTTNFMTCSDTMGTRAPASNLSLGGGVVGVPFSQGISGLNPGTTYYYCALVSNSYGMGVGAVMSFTTPTKPPTVETGYPVAMTRTTATLSGYGNPGGDATKGWFRYSTSSPGACNDTFGIRAPDMGTVALGSGTVNATFTQAITGLTPNTTYYVCALASNSMGMVWGSVVTFITPSSPTAVTFAATGIADTYADLYGAGRPNRANASGWFRYSLVNPGACDDKFGSRAPLMGSTNLGSDIRDQPYSQSVGGLSPGTTYYFCAIVASTEGTAFGAVLAFTTASASSVTTVAASNVQANSATLNGLGTPNGASATAWFRYSATNPMVCSDSFGTRTPTSSGLPLGAGTTAVPFGQSIGGLLPGTTYYFCALTSNGYGSNLGAVLSFTTPTTAPTVTTNYAANLTRTTAVLSGSANPSGDATTGWFRYSNLSPGTCNDTFGTRAPAMGGTALGSGTANVAFSETITGLMPSTTYYYCALASNALGVVWGEVRILTTPTAPTVVTLASTDVTTSSAQLNGSGNPNRGNTTGWFRYATTNPMNCDDKFGSRAPVMGGVALGSDIYDRPFAASISGLSPATTYYYCAIASSTEGTALGAVLTFTTSSPATVVTTPATSVTSTTATLNGTGNPNSAATTGWFRYALVNPGTCSDSFGTRGPSSGGSNLGSGIGSVAFGQPITGLAPGVTYYYCALASNAYGTGLGAVLSFTTPASPPTVSTDSVTGIAISLNGQANPNGATTTGWFRMATMSPGTCNDTFGTRVPLMGGTALGAGASYVAYSNVAPGLVAGTTYYYCALASNAQGTSFGVVRSFTAPSPPTVSTLAATPVTSTTATLNGSGNPNGNYTVGWFRYSTSSPGAMCTDVFGTRIPATGGQGLGSGTMATTFSEAITGLVPATTYYFCAFASSAYGTALGSVLSFTTPATVGGPPPKDGSGGGSFPADAVTTQEASDVGSEAAVLHATASANSEAKTGWFRYSTQDPGTCDDVFGTRAPLEEGQTLAAGKKPVAFEQAIEGLLPATTYYFCALAEGTGKARVGKVLSLTTPAGQPKLTTVPPTDVTDETAVLNGAAVPSGDESIGWFRYDTSDPGTCNDEFGVRVPAQDGQKLGKGRSAVAYALALDGVQRGTTYYYCAIGQNSKGVAVGKVLSFVAGTVSPAQQSEEALVQVGRRTAGIESVDVSKEEETAGASVASASLVPSEASTGCSFVMGSQRGTNGLEILPLASLVGYLIRRRRRESACARA